MAAGQATAAGRVTQRAEQEATTVTAAGRPVRIVRAIFVPDDETLFLLWAADSEESVREVARRCGLTFGRITTVRALPTRCPDPAAVLD